MTKFVIFLTILGIFSSCSKEKTSNKVNSNNPSNNPNGTYNNPSPLPQPQYQQTAPIPGVDLNRIKASFQCRYGQRLQNDVTFNVQATSGTHSTIGGNFQPGRFPGTGEVKMYIGASSFNDLMIVTKISNAGQALGFNVTLSMCSMVSNSGATYIHDSRPLTNFAASKGITLDDNPNCGYGSVDSAQMTYLRSQQSQEYPYLQPFNVYTTFTKVPCNGGQFGSF